MQANRSIDGNTSKQHMKKSVSTMKALCIRLRDDQRVQAWFLIIVLFMVVYCIARIRADMLSFEPGEESAMGIISDYPGRENCRRGLHFSTAINNQTLSVPVVIPATDDGPGCTVKNSGLNSVSLNFRITLIL